MDIFYAFACLMGGMDLAYELRDNTEYMLFPESSFPADYFSYEALQSIVTDVNGASALDIGKALCNPAYNYFHAPAVDRAFTLSRIHGLAAAVDYYANTAVEDMTLTANQSYYYSAAVSSLESVPLYNYYPLPRQWDVLYLCL